MLLHKTPLNTIHTLLYKIQEIKPCVNYLRTLQVVTFNKTVNITAESGQEIVIDYHILIIYYNVPKISSSVGELNSKHFICCAK